jgi:4-hydroxy-3-polyprenylbenzoate decarboxylase
VDSLDHSSRLPNYGSKMGINATRKWRRGLRAVLAVIRMPDGIKQRVDQLWKKAGLG